MNRGFSGAEIFIILRRKNVHFGWRALLFVDKGPHGLTGKPGHRVDAGIPSVVEDTVGWIYYLQQRYEAALPHLQKSLSLRDRPTARYHLAAVLMKSGQTEKARREFETAVRMDPKSEERLTVAPLFESDSRR